jgi:hypothetical protein
LLAALPKPRRLLQEQAAWVQLLQQYDALLAGGGTGQQQEQEQQQDPAEPAADAMQVDSAQQEEQEETMEGQEAAAAGKPDADAVAPAAAASPGPVSAEQEGVLRGVTLKVEMLTALVAKMEHLVSRAEATARSLQVRDDWSGGTCSGGGRGCASVAGSSGLWPVLPNP